MMLYTLKAVRELSLCLLEVMHCVLLCMLCVVGGMSAGYARRYGRWYQVAVLYARSGRQCAVFVGKRWSIGDAGVMRCELCMLFCMLTYMLLSILKVMEVSSMLLQVVSARSCDPYVGDREGHAGYAVAAVICCMPVTSGRCVMYAGRYAPCVALNAKRL